MQNPPPFGITTLPNGQCIDNQTGAIVPCNPIGPTVPGTGGNQVPPGAGAGGGGANSLNPIVNLPSSQGGTAAFLPTALKWIAALFLLWIILTALTEWNDNAKKLGEGFAGLILFGVLYKLGPDAITNVKNVWSK